MRKVLGTHDTEADPVYARSSFNERGDVIAHLSRVPSRREPPQETGRITGKPDDDVIDAIAEFARIAKRRGARVAFSYPGAAASAYGPHLAELRALDQLLRHHLGHDVIFLSVPEEFLFPPHMIFDTRYHLTGPGRALRSRRIAAALLRVL